MIGVVMLTGYAQDVKQNLIHGKVINNTKLIFDVERRNMKAENYINVKITVPIYTDRPNKNGCIYPKYAVEKALNEAKNLPLILQDEEKCIGVVNSIGFNREVNCDDQNEIILNCYLMKSDFEYIVNKKNDNVIQDFTITSFSLG